MKWFRNSQSVRKFASTSVVCVRFSAGVRFSGGVSFFAGIGLGKESEILVIICLLAFVL